jgi:hypothetical protein
MSKFLDDETLLMQMSAVIARNKGTTPENLSAELLGTAVAHLAKRAEAEVRDLQRRIAMLEVKAATKGRDDG